MEVRSGGPNAAARSTAAAVAALLVLVMAYQECNRQERGARGGRQTCKATTSLLVGLSLAFGCLTKQAPTSSLLCRSGLGTGSKRISRRTDVGGAGIPPPLPPPLPPEVAGGFVAATATADFRHDLVKAMRGWRRVRTMAAAAGAVMGPRCLHTRPTCPTWDMCLLHVPIFAGTEAAAQEACPHCERPRPPVLQGIRTLVLTNATGELLAREQQEGLRYNEVWLHYPDFSNISTGKPGDVRAAVTPAYVRSTLGTNFKWLIYGDVSPAGGGGGGGGAG